MRTAPPCGKCMREAFAVAKHHFSLVDLFTFIMDPRSQQQKYDKQKS